MQRMTSFKKQSLVIMLLVVAPVILGLIACDVYIMNAIFHTNVRENYSARLNSAGQSVSTRLSTIEGYMNSFMAAGTDFNLLSFPVDDMQLFDSTQRILERYKYVMHTDSELSGFLIYSSINDYYRIIENRDTGYISSAAMLSYLKGELAGGAINQAGWYRADIDGRAYMLRIMSMKNAYQMCFIDEEKFLAALTRTLSTGANEQLAFGEAGQAPAAFTITQEGGYRQIRLSSQTPELFAPLVMTADYAVQVLPEQALFIAVTLLLLLALIPVGIQIFRKTLLQPIESLGDTIARVRSGDMSAKVVYAGNVAEYAQLSRTFNEMMEEIEKLTIQRYEQQLEVQRTELQYLHLQIRPHFYLNCLKIVYGLAQCRDFATIQKLILLLSDYLRGIWSNESSITVEEEIHHVSTFVELNNLCNGEKVRYDAHVDDQARGFPLPPLLVLTFVENAIKHARVAEKELHVSLRVHVLETGDGRYLNISITDDGPGFTPQQLETLNSPLPQEEETAGHFGIFNIKERLHLIYQGRASITFMSAGGAGIEIFLPFEAEEATE